jgi:hypothetical protein
MVFLPRHFEKRFRNHVHIKHVHPAILEKLCIIHWVKLIESPQLDRCGSLLTLALVTCFRLVSVSRQAVHMSTQLVKLLQPGISCCMCVFHISNVLKYVIYLIKKIETPYFYSMVIIISATLVV